MHPQVQKLLHLQAVDQELSSLSQDIQSLPVEERKRRKGLEEAERQHQAQHQILLKAELDARALDKSVRGSDESIKKQNERLNTVRNNAEYQATLFQIENLRKDRDSMQEECLKLLEAAEACKPAVQAAEAKVAQERAVLEQFLVEAERLRAERAGAIAQVQSRRDALASEIAQDLLHEYEGLFKTRERMAVCAEQDLYCQGCYNKITQNDRARLLGKTSVVRCGSCQRILYTGS